MLSCQECEKYLVAFFDHALEVEEHLDIQEHLHTCVPCADRAEAERMLRVFVRQHAIVPLLPQHVQRCIIRDAIPASASFRWWQRGQAAIQLRDVMIGATAGAAVLLLALGVFSAQFKGEHILQKIAHEASLAYGIYVIQPMPLEVESAHAAVVMQWLTTRLGYPLQNPAMADETTQLLGGRLGHFLDRMSAAVIYQRRGVPVLLFAFKNEALSLPVKQAIRAPGRLLYVQMVAGRPIVMWQHDGITYSMVGDVDRHDLLQMASTMHYR